MATQVGRLQAAQSLWKAGTDLELGVAFSNLTAVSKKLTDLATALSPAPRGDPLYQAVVELKGLAATLAAGGTATSDLDTSLFTAKGNPVPSLADLHPLSVEASQLLTQLSAGGDPGPMQDTRRPSRSSWPPIGRTSSSSCRRGPP